MSPAWRGGGEEGLPAPAGIQAGLHRQPLLHLDAALLCPGLLCPLVPTATTLAEATSISVWPPAVFLGPLTPTTLSPRSSLTILLKRGGGLAPSPTLAMDVRRKEGVSARPSDQAWCSPCPPAPASTPSSSESNFSKLLPDSILQFSPLAFCPCCSLCLAHHA